MAETLPAVMLSTARRADLTSPAMGSKDAGDEFNWASPEIRDTNAAGGWEVA